MREDLEIFITSESLKIVFIAKYFQCDIAKLRVPFVNLKKVFAEIEKKSAYITLYTDISFNMTEMKRKKNHLSVSHLHGIHIICIL